MSSGFSSTSFGIPPSGIINNNNNNSSNVQRKLARQRQLELMEAEASGVAPPTMELNSMMQFGGDQSITDGSGRYIRSRGSSSNAATAAAASAAVAATAAASGEIERPSVVAMSSGIPKPTGNINPFERRDGPINQSLNLMDHEKGIYQQPETLSERLWKFLLSTRSSSTSSSMDNFHNDASPAMQEPDYVGTSDPRYPRKSSLSSSSTRLALLCSDTKRLCMILFGILFFLIGYSALLKTSNRDPLSDEDMMRNKHTKRFNDIYDHIIVGGISHKTVFLNYKSPEYHALRWLAYTDSSGIEPTDPAILTRYALAVFYYTSYQSFTKHAGFQDPITSADNEFWEGVPNPGWKRKDFWLSDQAHCMWYGVSCEPRVVNGGGDNDNNINDEDNNNNGDVEYRYNDHGNVLHLNMTNNHVKGQLVGELKALEHMTTLDLSGNEINGVFPPQLGFMFRLEILQLNDNLLVGTIPEEFSYLEGLRDAYVENNKLTGNLPTEISRLHNLLLLDLSGNGLTGSIPDISGCSKLTTLDLSNNRFDGFFPFGVAKLTNLRELHLQDNKLTGTLPPEIQSMENLRSIRVEDNKITGKIPGHMFMWAKNIHQVLMHNNALTGELPETVGSLEELHILTLNNNKISGTIPQSWLHLKGLAILHLYDNKLYGSIPDAIGDMTSLRELWLHNNEISGFIPSSLGSATSLQSVYLEQNKIVGHIDDTWASLSNLKTLRLHDNRFNGDVNQEVCQLKDPATSNHLTYFSTDCVSDVKCECCDRCY